MQDKTLMWYEKLSKNPTDNNILAEGIEYYESELENAKNDVNIIGHFQIQVAKMPGVVDHRYAQLQELESVLKFYEILYNKSKNKAIRECLEGCKKDFSSRDSKKIAECNSEVVNFEYILNRVARIRNKYLGIHKALEVKNFQLNNIAILYSFGLEDATI